MKTLFEIIEGARNNEQQDPEDLLYALLAVNALLTFEKMSLQKLAEAERENKPKVLVYSAEFQFEESFARSKRALAAIPKEWVGWSNDPKNPEFLARRKTALKLFEKFSGG